MGSPSRAAPASELASPEAGVEAEEPAMVTTPAHRDAPRGVGLWARLVGVSVLPENLRTAEAILRDPTASPATLERLFQEFRPLGFGAGDPDALFDESRRLLRMLGRNPNTPVPVLAGIAETSYPAARAVAQNPVFALALLVDPLCRQIPSELLAKPIAQRWPSDDDLAAALRPLLDEALEHPEAHRRVEGVFPGLMLLFRKSLGGRYPVRDALMEYLNPDPIGFVFTEHPRGMCLAGRGYIHCGELITREIHAEAAFIERLGLRVERWFASVALPG